MQWSRSAMNLSAASFYVIGGTLQRDSLSYVRRQADEDLFHSLKAGKFCYVLTARQMGKSSLMVRTVARLQAEGRNVGVLALTSIGQNLTVEQWYDSLLNQISEQSGLVEQLDDFWFSHERLNSLQRWTSAIVEVVLARCNGQVIIFIDEIDAVLNLPFSTDEFFAAIRELYNRRAQEPELSRLSFCLMGVAMPSDLI